MTLVFQSLHCATQHRKEIRMQRGCKPKPKKWVILDKNTAEMNHLYFKHVLTLSRVYPKEKCYSLMIGFLQDLKIGHASLKGLSWFDNDDVLFLCPKRKFAIRRSQAIPLLHMLDGFMYRQTREGPVCRSILQPQVYHQLLLCE